MACHIANLLNAEIVCADSRQIYRGLPIGSAMPSLTQRQGIPHHLYGVLSPDQPCSAGAYRELAHPVIREIHARGKLPLLVGGTGLYLEAVTGEIGLAPPLKPETIQVLRTRQEREGPEIMWKELAGIDPAAARAISPRDSQRIIRAMGIFLDTGRRREEFAGGGAPLFSPVAKAALDVPRQVLYRRIDERCEAMFRAGLMEEARGLKQAGFSQNLPALKSIGYRYLYAVIDGKLSPSEATTLMQRDTRRYAKRQLTWLRGRGKAAWVEWGDIAATAQIIASRFNLTMQEENKCA